MKEKKKNMTIATQVSPAREAEIAHTMAFRLFESRHGVYHDYHWRKSRIREIRNHIATFRAYQKANGHDANRPKSLRARAK